MEIEVYGVGRVLHKAAYAIQSASSIINDAHGGFTTADRERLRNIKFELDRMYIELNQIWKIAEKKRRDGNEPTEPAGLH